MLEYIRSLLDEKTSCTFLFKRNIAKEYLQILVLTFLYTHDDYRHLIFYGGSCLRHCYGLPRLSEDLDFVDIGKRVDIKRLLVEVKRFFANRYDITVTSRIQRFRCILKFPVLRALGLATESDSDMLFLKVEIYREFDFCKKFDVEIKPVFKFGESVLIKTFDLPTLMATKIHAIMQRKWEKTAKDGKILAVVKGRDYYDLMWYLQQGVKPNMHCFDAISSERDLYSMLLGLVDQVDSQSVKYDLEGLIEDPAYLNVLKDNIRDILTSIITDRM
ncbi:nucleotidyl transferase AbiEii/AbiGii toxin family protein [candidate division WOR-3 bacterium]|nr:nucleotidyl transferase AbiEii/AbiGii toxin family protein [candidate division WOR-3 bacterium]